MQRYRRGVAISGTSPPALTYAPGMDNVTALPLATAEFDRRLVAVADADWDRPTPCDNWTVRDLVAHVVAGNAMAAAVASGATGDEATEVFVSTDMGEDPIAAFRESAQAQLDALSDPEVLDRTVHHPAMDMPGAQLVGFRVTDLLVHGWDLARAIGTDETLDPAVAAVVLANLEPMRPMIGSIGRFGDGPSGNVGSDDDVQTQVLDLSGRRP
jgi:uncharacterized protein (TIGR03086 family)